jgi:5-hydroxyisourate hydrolase
MSGKLTTHILDTARGCPASGITIELWAVYSLPNRSTLLKSVTTNADGRALLLSDGDLKIGTYELVFAIGNYFSEFYEPDHVPFLDRVPIRFGVANPDSHYHIPLLASPWSYSTYRGS